MKTTSSFAIGAVVAAMASTSAMAADLGGNCCSDLEERVAELEATTARKGNRRVSLEVSGHVHEAIVFWEVDSDEDALDEANVYIGTHNSSRSRFRFKGSAKIDSDWSAGFLMEFGVRRNNLAGLRQDRSLNTSGIDIRHEALYLKSNKLGTVWLGWTSSAADGITEICLGCGLGNGPDYNDDMAALLVDFGAPFSVHGGGSGAFAGEGDRRDIVRYISPELAGFVFSAAYGSDDFYDVALRYANEWNGVRVAAGVAYQYSTSIEGRGIAESSCLGDALAFPDRECHSIGASASMQHVPSGLYVAGAYGYYEDDAFGGDGYNWHITAGVNRKWSPLGSTNIWGMYTYGEDNVQDSGFDRELRVYGVGLEQNIDAAALSIYVWWKRMEADRELTGISAESDQVVIGSRIRF